MRKLRDACFEQARPVSLALDIFPVTLQKSLDKYMSKRSVLHRSKIPVHKLRIVVFPLPRNPA